MSSFSSAHDRLAATPTGSSQHRRQGGVHQRYTVSFSSSATDLLRMRRRGGSTNNRGAGGVSSPLSRTANTVNLGDQLGSSVELASTATVIRSSPQTLQASRPTATTIGLPSPPRRTQSSPAVNATTTTQARYERAADRREINRLGSNLDRVRSTMERRLMQHVDEANSSSELLGRAQRLTDRLAVLKRKLEMCFDLNDQIGNRRPGASLDRESAMSQVMAARAMLGNNYNPLGDEQYDLSGATRSLRHLTDTQRQQLESLVRSEPTVLGMGGGMGAHRGGVDTDGWQSYDPSAFVDNDSYNYNQYPSAAAASSSSSYTRGGGVDSIVLSPHMILQQLMADVETDDAPPDFICPITQCVMIDPVTTSDGNVYERAAITQWFLSFQHRNKIPTSPLTNLELSDFTLNPHDVLRKAISQYLRGLMGGGSIGGNGPSMVMGDGSGDGTAEWRNPTTTHPDHMFTSEDEAVHPSTGDTSVAVPTPASTHGPLSEEPSRRFLSLLQSVDTAPPDDASDDDVNGIHTGIRVVVPPPPPLRQKAPSPPPNHTSGVKNTNVASRGGGGGSVGVLRGVTGPPHTTPTPPNPSSLSSSSVTAAAGGVGGGDSRPIWSSAVVPVDEPNSRFLNRLRLCEEADDYTLVMLATEGVGWTGNVPTNNPPLQQQHNYCHGTSHHGGTVRRPPVASTRSTNRRGEGGSDGGGVLYEHRRLVPVNVFSSPSITLPNSTATTVPSSSSTRRVPTTTTNPSSGVSRFGFNGAPPPRVSGTPRSPSLQHPRGSSSPANLNSRRKL